MFKFVIAAVVVLAASSAAASGRGEVIESLISESKVVSAEWRSASEMILSVRDDGTRRDGFAEYVCTVISDHGLRPEPPVEFFLISIVDANLWPGTFRKLGWTACPRGAAGQNALVDDLILIDNVTGVGVESGVVKVDIASKVEPENVAKTVCDLVERHGFNALNPVRVDVRGDLTVSRDCR